MARSGARGLTGRVKRVAQELIGLVRYPKVAEVSKALESTIEVVRFEGYEESVERMLGREARAEFDRSVDLELGKNPEHGSTIANTGSWRKLRVNRPDQRRGDRGGARVIYYYAPEIRCAFLALAYGKDEADDLSDAGKKWLRELAADCEAYRPKRR